MASRNFTFVALAIAVSVSSISASPLKTDINLRHHDLVVMTCGELVALADSNIEEYMQAHLAYAMYIDGLYQNLPRQQTRWVNADRDVNRKFLDLSCETNPRQQVPVRIMDLFGMMPPTGGQ